MNSEKVRQNTMNLTKTLWMSLAVYAMLAIGFLSFGSSADAGMPEVAAQLEEPDFILLCAEAEPEVIRKALAEGADPNMPWQRSSREVKAWPSPHKARTPLQAAVKYNLHLESVKVLLEAGAEVNADSGGALLAAVKRNEPEYVSLLLQNGARPQAVNDPSGSLVFTAAAKDPVIFEELLKAGADIRARNRNGETALHFAMLNNSPKPLSLLLAAGLDPNAADHLGNTPLHRWHIKSPLFIEALAKAGADVNRENRKGLAPFEVNDDDKLLDAFITAGARLVTEGADGRVKTRGFAKDSTGYSRLRFFAADEPDFMFHLRPGQPTALQKLALSEVVLETGLKVNDPPEGEKYSEKVCWYANNSDEPLTGVIYYIETRQGAFAYGKVGANGCNARIYSPGPEDLKWETFSSAEEAAGKILASEKTNYLFDKSTYSKKKKSKGKAAAEKPRVPKHGERVCFVNPETRLPVYAYPYFLLSPEGYAIAGKTGENGCSAELFVPGPGPFKVYGGFSAISMNVKGGVD